jgi:hypothetical protein
MTALNVSILTVSWSNGYVKFMVASAWPQMIPNLFVRRSVLGQVVFELIL